MREFILRPPCNMNEAMVTDTYWGHLARTDYDGNAGVDIGPYYQKKIPCLACHDWSKAETKSHKDYGLYVNLYHPNGSMMTRYAHLDSYAVKPQGKAGDQIGIIGKTGKASGVHLHLELWLDKKLADPWPLMYFGPIIPTTTTEKPEEFKGFTQPLLVKTTTTMLVREGPSQSFKRAGFIIHNPQARYVVLDVVKEDANIWMYLAMVAPPGQWSYCPGSGWVAYYHEGRQYLELAYE